MTAPPAGEAAILPHAARVLADAMPDGVVVVSPAGSIEFVNQRLVELTGFSAENLIGHPIETLVPVAARSQHVGHRERYVADAHPRPMGTTLAITCLRNDGSAFEADIALSPLQLGTRSVTLASIRNVGARRELERAQHDLESRYRLMVESVDEYAIMLLDAQGRISSWNTGAARVHGYTAHEAMGSSFAIFHTPDDVRDGHPDHLLAVARSEGRADDSGWRVRKDGTRFFASVSLTPVIDDEGVLRGFAKIVHDETDRREARDHHRRLQLLEQRERIARDLHDGAIQRIFAVGMNLQAASLGDVSDDTRTRLEASVTELDGVISDLRRYIFGLRSEETAGAIQLQIQALADDLQTTYAITAALEVDESALEELRGRSADVLMVLQEAMSNVGRHSGASTVRIAVGRGQGIVKVVVDDDGHGYEVGTGTAGLGLGNMRDRIEEQMGSLSIVSSLEGTTVTITLPELAG